MKRLIILNFLLVGPSLLAADNATSASSHAHRGGSHVLAPLCRPDTSSSALALADYVRSLVTATDTALSNTRQAYSLPVASANDVMIVSDSTICVRAAEAFRKNAGRIAGNLHAVDVIGLAGSRYVVSDPSSSIGEFQLHFVFDTSFTRLAAFAG